jgi:hypothetical protein
MTARRRGSLPDAAARPEAIVDDDALALVATLDPAVLAWLTAEFGRRAASMRRSAARLEDVLHRAWPRAGQAS